MSNSMNTRSKRKPKLKHSSNDINSNATKAWFLDLKTLLSIIAVLFAVWFAQQVYSWHLKRLVSTPFERSSPLSVGYSSRKWGTVKSGYYLGIKSLSPFSLTSGLMWFRNEIVGNTIPIRHWCSQSDGIKKYTWLKHDFNSFGVQEIIDSNIKLITKVILNENQGWFTKVSVSSVAQSLVEPVSVVWYWKTEVANDYIFAEETSDANFFYATGSLLNVGNFTTRIRVSKSSKIIYSGPLSTGFAPQPLDLKETVLHNLFWLKSETEYGHIFALKRIANTMSNVVMYQIVAVPPFDFVVEFKLDSDAGSIHEINDFETMFERRRALFDIDFESKFKLIDKGYGESEISFAKAALSNMIGSVGYFYGSSLVQSKYNENPVKYGPLELLTAVPSRSFFPRGFLWDEGFHNLLISKFKPDLSFAIVNSWFNLMNVEGWIPREVILGADAEVRVPAEFIVQNNTNGNPPALFLTLKSMLDSNILKNEEIRDLFPRLQLWYSWFNTSQIGLRDSTYRWRGRNAGSINELNPKTLTSGLDDYPRASHPTDEEYHLDLRCWMAFASKVMAEFASKIGHTSRAVYDITANYLHDNDLLEKLHWSPEFGMFCDFGLHSLNMKLMKQKNGEKKTRRVLSNPQFGCVPEFGYVSLFPLMLTILEPTNPKIHSMFAAIQNENLLWTPFGLRSLAKNSVYYNKYNTEVDAPYWRGAIWINMNFLVLRALKYYGLKDGPYRNESLVLYSKLRNNIVTNVYTQYTRTGYIWEQYDDKTGRGKGSHPFTGWSSLVVLIMSEQY